MFEVTESSFGEESIGIDDGSAKLEAIDEAMVSWAIDMVVNLSLLHLSMPEDGRPCRAVSGPPSTYIRSSDCDIQDMSLLLVGGR